MGAGFPWVGGREAQAHFFAIYFHDAAHAFDSNHAQQQRVIHRLWKFDPQRIARAGFRRTHDPCLGIRRDAIGGCAGELFSEFSFERQPLSVGPSGINHQRVFLAGHDCHAGFVVRNQPSLNAAGVKE